MLKKVVLAGGTGFVGQYFEKHSRNLGYEVRIISRQTHTGWEDKEGIRETIDHPYRNLVKFGMGGHQGSGNQKFSWIHIEDLFNIVLFLRKNQELCGVFNCSSPHPVTNRELMAHLRKLMNIRIGLPCPTPMLKMGAFFMGTETELIVKSRWVIPERLEKAGYAFKFHHLDEALEQILMNS
ncbi:DUF1731 domain-containing protein [Peribacillus sp. NPDC094092]|uniref:DUF1731 domain-containing protein n=1 Tax=Peribacillus sp. NPDC094092 TaxID=3390611 RepID=UPI003D00F966